MQLPSIACGSATAGASSSPTKKPRGRPRKAVQQAQPGKSDADPAVQDLTGAGSEMSAAPASPAKKARGRPRKVAANSASGHAANAPASLRQDSDPGAGTAPQPKATASAGTQSMVPPRALPPKHSAGAMAVHSSVYNAYEPASASGPSSSAQHPQRLDTPPGTSSSASPIALVSELPLRDRLYRVQQLLGRVGLPQNVTLQQGSRPQASAAYEPVCADVPLLSSPRAMSSSSNRAADMHISHTVHECISLLSPTPSPPWHQHQLSASPEASTLQSIAPSGKLQWLVSSVQAQMEIASAPQLGPSAEQDVACVTAQSVFMTSHEGQDRQAGGSFSCRHSPVLPEAGSTQQGKKRSR